MHTAAGNIQRTLWPGSVGGSNELDVDAGDLGWLDKIKHKKAAQDRCPGIRIMVSSSSPRLWRIRTQIDGGLDETYAEGIGLFRRWRHENGGSCGKKGEIYATTRQPGKTTLDRSKDHMKKGKVTIPNSSSISKKGLINTNKISARLPPRNDWLMTSVLYRRHCAGEQQAESMLGRLRRSHNNGGMQIQRCLSFPSSAYYVDG